MFATGPTFSHADPSFVFQAVFSAFLVVPVIKHAASETLSKLCHHAASPGESPEFYVNLKKKMLSISV